MEQHQIRSRVNYSLECSVLANLDLFRGAHLGPQGIPSQMTSQAQIPPDAI